MKKFLSIIFAIFMMAAAFAVEPSKLSKLSQLKGIDIQKIENAEDPSTELCTQLERLVSNLYNKVDWMKDDGQEYKKYLHFHVPLNEYVYCYVVKYNDGSNYLVIEYKNEERFFSSEILNTKLYMNEDGDPLFSEAPGVAIIIYTKAGPIIILDDADSSYDYYVIDPR